MKDYEASLTLLVKTFGNWSITAKKLGIAPRTFRDLRNSRVPNQRFMQQVTTLATLIQKEQLIEHLCQNGVLTPEQIEKAYSKIEM